MSESTDQAGGASPRGAIGRLWAPAGVVFLAGSLAALAAGAFIEWIMPSHVAQLLQTPPTLRLLLAVQAGGLILFAPLVMAKRRGAGSGPVGSSGDTGFQPVADEAEANAQRARGPFYLTTCAELALLLVASAPFYVVAAWLGDATVVDVARGVLYIVGVALGAWGLGLWAADGRGWLLTAAALVAALAAVGAPVTYYLLAELAGSAGRVQWLWSAGPVTCAFSVGQSRLDSLLPQPLWAWLLWPAVGAALAFGRLLVGADKSGA